MKIKEVVLNENFREPDLAAWAAQGVPGTGVEPKQAAKPSQLPRGQEKALGQFQTADDFVRSVANAATFGLADKFAAKMSGKDYKKELEKQTQQTQAAGERSPTATTAGDIVGTVGSVPFLGGAALGAKALAKATPRLAQKAMPKIAATTAGGMAADAAADELTKEK
jgi:hypothetical protein